MSTAAPYVQVTGWLCVALLLLLLYRGMAGKTWRVYPLFFIYIANVFVTTVIGLSVKWAVDSEAYAFYYWVTEGIASVLGIGVTWEIHRRILSRYPGVRRLAGMLLSFIFATVFFISTAGRRGGPFSLVELERDMRTAQAIILLILFALIAYYAIPLGKNVRGIAIGYVFGIATSVLNLSLGFYFGRSFYPVLAVCQAN
jgi:hypothetical protein